MLNIRLHVSFEVNFLDKFSVAIYQNQLEGGKNAAQDFTRWWLFPFLWQSQQKKHESQNVESRKVQHDQMLCVKCCEDLTKHWTHSTPTKHAWPQLLQSQTHKEAL